MNYIVRLRLLTLCFFGFLLSFISNEVNAQGQDCDVELLLPPDFETLAGDSFCVDIRVNNFEDIILGVFVINFNSTVLRLDSWDPTVSGLPGFVASDITYRPQVDPDIIRVFWQNPNLDPTSLPDGADLLQLCFTAIGTPGTEAELFINDTGLNAPSEFIMSVDINLPSTSLTVCNPDPSTGRISIVPPPSTEPQIFSTAQCGTTSGLDEGIVELKVFFGSPDYTVVSSVGNIVGTNNQDVFVFENVPLGSHTFTAVDNVGLSSTEITVEITDDPAFAIDLIALNVPSCPNELDGRIAVEISGGRPFGTGQFFFDWGAEQIGLGESQLNNLPNGTYNVVVTDSLGCRQSESFELARSEIQIMTTNSVDALCDGISDGALSVVGTGGGPFSDGYNWNISFIEADSSRTPVGSPVPTDFTQDYTSLMPGVYEIIATDSVDRFQRCPAISTFEINVQRELGAEFQEVDPSNNTCPAGLSPAILDLTSTQTPVSVPINVQLVDSTGATVFDDIATSASIDAGCLPAGIYTAFIQDSDGCLNTLDVDLSQGATINLIDSMAVNPNCFGAMDGFITVDVTTDSPPLLFEWSTGDMGADVDSIGGLPSGSYTLNVSDQSGAIETIEFILVDPVALNVNLGEADGITCPGGLGSIMAEVTGGDGNNTFFWPFDGMFTNNGLRTDLPPGDYSVEVTDLSGCVDSASFTLVDPIAPMTSLSNINAPSCPGDNSGTAVLTVTTTNDFMEPFSFESSTGQVGGPNNFVVTNFPSGDDNFILYSQGTCIFDTVFVEIPEATPFSIDQANTTMTEIACFGDSDFQTGSTVNLAIDGPNNVNILWLDDGTMGNTRVGLPADVYFIELSVGSCTILDSIIIDQPDSIAIAVDSTNSIFARCGGDNNTELVVEVTGGTPDYSIVWLDENNQPISTGFMASNLVPGPYTVDVTDANGCDAQLAIEVTEPDPVVATIGTVSEAICSSDRGFLTIAEASGGVGGPYRFQIGTAPALTVGDTAMIIPGDITVSVFDQDGCVYDTMILVLPPTELNVSLGEDTEVELGQSTVVRANIDSESMIDTVRWIPEDVECIDALCSEVSFSPVGPTTLSVEVTDVNGCVATDEVSINVRRTSNIYIPNAFSPTATVPGNATFRVFGGSGVSSVDFIRIYDRYGNLVHAEEGSQPIVLSGVGTWNGSFNNDLSQELESGVYVYVVQFSFIDGGDPELRRGNVTLIR